MSRRPANADSTHLLYKADVSVRKTATGQGHPEIVVQPERWTILVRKYVRRNCFVHVSFSFLSQTRVACAATVADLLPILAKS